jgi:hypothetical protein
MTLEHRPMERAELRRRLLISLTVVAVVAVVAVIAVVGTVVFGWTLPAADFTITTDPAGKLPF